LSKEGLNKDVREDFYEKSQSVNRYVIGRLMLSEPVLAVLRRELKRMAEGVKVDASDVEQIVQVEVLKREVVEGEEADAALTKVNKFYRKGSPRRTKKPHEAEPLKLIRAESVTDRLLREANNGEETNQTDPADQ
jgi:hypothetical protein